MSSVPADHLGGGTPPWCVTRSTVNGRENNEDSFHAYQLVPTPGRPPMIVLSLADGMGGHAFGECVSREALRKVALTLFENLVIESGLNVLGAGPPLTRQSLERALMGALELANAHILRMVEANHWPKAGSTLVCAVVVGARAVVANLGDSPLFLYRDGVVTQITEDHTVAGVLLRAGLITPEMARVHEGRGRLEFFVGAKELPTTPPLHDLPLEPGDVLLLCSDGVCGSLAPEEMAACLRDAADLTAAADRLLAAALAAGETDNQTLILWQYQPRDGELVLEDETVILEAPAPPAADDGAGDAAPVGAEDAPAVDAAPATGDADALPPDAAGETVALAPDHEAVSGVRDLLRASEFTKAAAPSAADHVIPDYPGVTKEAPGTVDEGEEERP